jgi:hypothetical protein
MSVAEREEAESRMQVYEAMALQVQESLERQEELRKEIELSERLLTTGNNKKALATTSAKSNFAARHDMSQEEIDDLAGEATSKTRGQIKNEQASA